MSPLRGLQEPRVATRVQSKGLSRVFSNTTVQKLQFFSAQLSSQSNSHIHTSLAPHERLPEILVVPREKTPTGGQADSLPLSCCCYCC